MIPVVVMSAYTNTPLGRWVATITFAYACITDFFDGYLARRWQKMSPLGRFLDPIADKLLIASVILVLVAKDDIAGISLLPALVILLRELLVSGLREFLAEIKVTMPVTWLTKWKTAVQMIALGCLTLGPAGPKFIEEYFVSLNTLGLVCLWAAAFLTLITGYDYLQRGIKKLA